MKSPEAHSATTAEQRLYPKRPSEAIAQQVKELDRLEAGEGVIELSPKEKEWVLDAEQKLAERLEELSRPMIRRAIYFNHTPKAHKPFREMRKEGLTSFNEMRTEFYNAITESFDPETGSFDFSLFSTPEKHVHTDNPEAVAQKEKDFRSFREVLKQEISKREQTAHGNKAEQSFLVVLELYKRRVNHLLAETMAPDANDRNTTRYTKFIYGAGSGGKVVSESLEAFATQVEQERSAWLEQKFGQERNEAQKVGATKISAQDAKQLVELALDAYGVLSKEDATSYDSHQEGYADDGGWQVILENRASAEVRSKQRVVVLPDKEVALRRALQVFVGHEVEGHVLQEINREQFPLELVQKSRTDRWVSFYEAGSMNSENAAAEAIFDDQKIPHTGYLRATQKRLEGGSYIDCVEAFYNVLRDEYVDLREKKLISEEQFEKFCRDDVKIAMSSAMRLFRQTENLDGGDGVVTNAKDLVYLEQRMLFEELRKAGKEDYAYISGVNAQTLADLARAGLLKLEQIQRPKQVTQKIWQQCLEDYEKQRAHNN